MLELAASGAKVLQLRSVEFARNHNVRLHVRSTFADADGTLDHARRTIRCSRRRSSPESCTRARSSCTACRDRRRAAVRGSRFRVGERRHDRPGRAPTRSSSRRRPRIASTPNARSTRSAPTGRLRDDLGKVSVIGAGMKSHPGDRGEDVRDAARRGRRARRRDDVADQDRVPRSGRTTSRRPCARSTRRSTCLESRIVGATGAAGARPARPDPRLGRRAATSRPRARPARSSTVGVIEEATPDALAAGGFDLCFFAIGATGSRELVPHAVRGGAVAIDKSSAWRMEPNVPLVVPEVNGDRALEHEGVVAVPNCSTIQMTVALKPLHDAAGLRSIRVATYQSVSGAGKQAMERLRAQSVEEHDARGDWTFDGEEFEEETKIQEETRKILELPDLPVQADVRARAGARRPPRGGVDRDRGRALAGATRARCSAAPGRARRRHSEPERRPPASTTCSSAACAATRPRRTASRSWSPATTSARAQP